MTLAKTIVVVAYTALLSAAAIGSARNAYAQNAGATDSEAGSWSAEGTGSADLDRADESSPEARGTPLNIGGCWSGDVNDQVHGLGTAVFAFVQNGSSLQNTSSLSFRWGDGSGVFESIHGSVSSMGIKFKDNLPRRCFSGKGMGDTSVIAGKINFKFVCGTFFKNATFSISPGC
jgi:hypothetical protein